MYLDSHKQSASRLSNRRTLRTSDPDRKRTAIRWMCRLLLLRSKQFTHFPFSIFHFLWSILHILYSIFHIPSSERANERTSEFANLHDLFVLRIPRPTPEMIQSA